MERAHPERVAADEEVTGRSTTCLYGPPGLGMRRRLRVVWRRVLEREGADLDVEDLYPGACDARRPNVWDLAPDGRDLSEPKPDIAIQLLADSKGLGDERPFGFVSLARVSAGVVSCSCIRALASGKESSSEMGMTVNF